MSDANESTTPPVPPNLHRCCICEKAIQNWHGPDGDGVLKFCGNECTKLWEKREGLERVCIEECQPGRKYDGLLDEL
jgi:hypothetical protein